MDPPDTPTPGSHFYHRDDCRLCGGRRVELVLEMPSCPPVDDFIPASRLAESQPLFPMDLYLCRECGHAQLLDVVSPELLFGDYLYTTAGSPGLIGYFEDYAATVMAQLKVPAGASVLDIGSNDGTLLRFFKRAGYRVLGVDPAARIAATATAEGIETVPGFFTRALAGELRSRRGPFDLITANNVFAHADALGDMAEGARWLLPPSGVFVFEVSHLLDLVQGMFFDTVCHEHLSYHSLKPLRRFLAAHGLHLFHVDTTPSKGGSIRCFAQPAGGPRLESPRVEELVRLEESAGLYRPETYAGWSRRIQAAREALARRLEESRAAGRRLAGYGASATATVLSYSFELGPWLEFVVDDNRRRQGLFTPGWHTPVVGAKALLTEAPDEVVVLVWRFAEMIAQRNQAYLERGGRFIVPLPELRVITAQGTSTITD
jgi:SAM-dependent methyltransferase